MTLVPLALYLTARGLIKVELGLCRAAGGFTKGIT
jgi:tmRNA-binding protein